MPKRFRCFVIFIRPILFRGAVLSVWQSVFFIKKWSSPALSTCRLILKKIKIDLSPSLDLPPSASYPTMHGYASVLWTILPPVIPTVTASGGFLFVVTRPAGSFPRTLASKPGRSFPPATLQYKECEKNRSKKKGHRAGGEAARACRGVFRRRPRRLFQIPLSRVRGAGAGAHGRGRREPFHGRGSGLVLFHRSAFFREDRVADGPRQGPRDLYLLAAHDEDAALGPSGEGRLSPSSRR